MPRPVDLNLVVPFQWPFIAVMGCMIVAMLIGYLDDRTQGGWSEYALGACDLAVSLTASKSS